MELTAATPLPWQTEVWRRFLEIRRQRRLGHALLLSGPTGLGKSPLARRLAQALLCREPAEEGLPCGNCRDCRLFDAGNHPDFRQLTPDESTGRIRVDAIRELLDDSVLVVGEGRARLFLIDPAEAMGVAAANALLKTLEEPPAGVHLLLVATHPEQLPVTIRSRCQQLPLRPPSTAQAIAWLGERADLEAGRAAPLLEMAGGGPVTVLHWLESGKDRLLERWRREFFEVAEGRADPSGVAESWLKEADLSLLLRLLGAWLGGLLRKGAMGERVAEISSLPSPAALHSLLDKLFETQRRLANNPNPQLALEALLVEWRRTTGR